MKRQSTVVFYDGTCSFCSASVQYIVGHDTAGRFRFCSQQSPLGQQVIQRFGPFGDTMFVYHAGRFYRRSAAAMFIGRGLHRRHRLVSTLALALPRALLDVFYDAFARHRHAFPAFGPLAQCRMPSKAFMARVIA